MNSQIYESIGDFISLIFPDIEVVQGQADLVPMLNHPCAVMAILNNKRLSTNIHRYNDTGNIDTSTEGITRKSAVKIQVDFFGDGSETRAHDFCTAFYDDYGFSRMRGAKPLSVTDPVKITFIDDEQNRHERWMCEADVQINRETVVPQQYFGKPNFQHIDGDEGITPVDIFYEV